MKLFREEYLTKNPKNKKTVENEIQILKELSHKGVIRLQEYGMNGCVKKQSGKVMNGLTYILLEYAPGGTLFSLCESQGAMGEDSGRFFMNQMIEVLSYMHSK